MIRRAQLLIALLACAGALAVSAGGASAGQMPQTRPAVVVHTRVVAHPATVAAVAKFLAHAGAAFYVFDHFIWKPYKAGDLHGFTHKLKIAEAALAALFVYHEVKVMAGDVKDSKLLSFLATPITAAVSELSALKSDISGGHLDALSKAQSDLGAIKQQSNAKGYVIKEITHSI